MPITEQQLALISLGGPVVFILLAMSVFGLAIFFFKLIEFRQFSNRRLGKLEALVLARQGPRETEVPDGSLGKQVNPLSSLVMQAIQWLEEGDYGTDLVREELEVRGREILAKVNGLLGFLEQIVLLAPLLGLLGTVLGIIDVFQELAVTDVGGQSSSLAAGIWEALLTTAMGMAVAIPFSIMHWFLSSRAGNIALRIEGLFTKLFTGDLHHQKSGSDRDAMQ